MKDYAKSILLILLLLILIYGWFAFAELHFNPFNWRFGARCAFGGFSVVGIMAIISNLINEE